MIVHVRFMDFSAASVGERLFGKISRLQSPLPPALLPQPAAATARFAITPIKWAR